MESNENQNQMTYMRARKINHRTRFKKGVVPSILEKLEGVLTPKKLMQLQK